MAAAVSSLVVENPGLLTTVQDLGRPGYGPLGVSPSGAADAVALRLGNMLVGNEQGAAALEMTLVGGRYTFPEGGVIALAGADFGANLEGRPMEMWVPHAVRPGGTLELGLTRDRGALLSVHRGRDSGGTLSWKCFDASAERIGRICGARVAQGRCGAIRRAGAKNSPQKNFGEGAGDAEAEEVFARDAGPAGGLVFGSDEARLF